ncbi:MAG: CapA family protein [Clostridiales bacterium]|nr:CapA family protein [Clostridiales bacterium]
MRRKKSNLNKKLNFVLLVMTTILILLIAITYVDTNIIKQKTEDKSSANTEDSSDTNTSLDSKVTEDDITDSSDSSGSTQADNNSSENEEPLPDDTSEVEEPLPKEPIVLAFAGDVNLDEDSKPVARYDRENKGILGGISQDLVDVMNQADIFMLNNEFAYSTRGSEIKEKSYTFRANPKRVDILKEIGVDIVSLANNHALDFGQEALLDTFTTLDEAEIDYVGAGIDMDRAKAPIYYTIGNTTIAYVAASHVIYAMDWYATDTQPGMIGTYDPTLFVASIKEAKENSDFVVVYVHWGKERVHEPVEYQKNLAKIYIDAGADAVIGCHPHVMQGIEFYKGKTIAYSLGNYWFNASKRESGLLKIYLNPDGTTDTQLLPVMNDNTYTYQITEEDNRKAYYKFMEDISFNVEYDENGFVSEKIN